MYEELFKSLGMSPNEAKIYEALIDLGEASVNTLSVKTKINRSNVYDAMERLCEKGLASQLFVRYNKFYKANHPRRLSELLKEKQEEVEACLPDLVKKFESRHTEEEAFFHRGIEAFRTYMFDVLREKKPYFCIGGKGTWFDPKLTFFRLKFDRERKKSNITFHHLFDEHMKQKLTDPLHFERNVFRFIPQKYCSKLTVNSFGEYTVIYTTDEYGKIKKDPAVFVIKSKDIAEGFQKIFEFMWDHCDAKKS